ncbi:MAG: 4-(cytidine 5'-diphospho)-2-C-methyl-D-erythritol kinase [Pseudomonadota bacterium]
MTTVEVFAPAKINLTLHVTGQTPNGYHMLDSLVAFADIGDRVYLSTKGPAVLDVTGPEAAPELSSLDNIMWYTALQFWKPDIPLSMALEKHLPMASGIGGGSADAAATYRGILLLRNVAEGGADAILPQPEDARKLLQIGADVPMCVMSETARVRGIGEWIDPIAGFPKLPLVLVNPRTQVSTQSVFMQLANKENPEMSPWPTRLDDPKELIAWLGQQRNDLQAPAIADCPVIAEVLDAVTTDKTCRFARMSGSGATCFALYDDLGAAQTAAERLTVEHPDWWVKSGSLNGGNLVEPQLIRSTT